MSPCQSTCPERRWSYRGSQQGPISLISRTLNLGLSWSSLTLPLLPLLPPLLLNLCDRRYVRLSNSFPFLWYIVQIVTHFMAETHYLSRPLKNFVFPTSLNLWVPCSTRLIMTDLLSPGGDQETDTLATVQCFGQDLASTHYDGGWSPHNICRDISVPGQCMTRGYFW